MEFWEFLLQKDGDRSWLPLESDKVDLVEGRYRVVARSGQSNIPVEVRVIHDATTEIPPMRRTQRRYSKTNKDGMVVIMPFTRLLPGIWELRCTSDLMADMLGEGWQYVVQLRVQSAAVNTGHGKVPDPHSDTIAAEGEEEIALEEATPNQADAALPEPIAPEAAAQFQAAHSDSLAQEAPPAPATPLPSSAPGSPERPSADDLLPLMPRSAASADSQSPMPDSSIFQPAEQRSDQVVGSVFQELDDQFETSADATEAEEGSRFPSSTPVADRSSIYLRLGQNTFVVKRGQLLTLMGQIEKLGDPLTDSPFTIDSLQVRLYDPRTSKILVEKCQPLICQRLPFPFTCQVSLPDSYQTYLVLGEVLLHGTDSGNTVVLATQSFSVTTDLHELLEAIANDFSESELPLPPEAAPSTSESEENASNVSFFNLPAASEVPVQFRPSSQPALPPQLHPANPSKLRRPPELPSFPQWNAEADDIDRDEMAEADNVPSAEWTTEGSIDRPEFAVKPSDAEGDATLNDMAEATRTDAFAVPAGNGTAQRMGTADSRVEHPPTPSIPQAFDDDAPIPDWDKSDEYLPQWRSQSQPSALPGSPEDVAFRSLNLQERFWERLQALVADKELATWLSDLQATEVGSLAHGSEDLPEAALNRRRQNRTIGLDAELAAQEVVVEDELAPTPRQNQTAGSLEELSSAMLVLPITDPVPVPQLELTTGELVAGQSLNVTVKLPNLKPRILVKLWMRDRQSRSMLNEPRWLMDFIPDGLGHLIARTELTVPHGCLEMQLEAIAIEAATQRESDKAIVIREVVPPDLSTFSFDELDV